MITTIIVVDSFIEGALYNTLSFLKHSSCVIVKLDIYSTTKDNIHTKIQEYITNEMETQTFNITKILFVNFDILESNVESAVFVGEVAKLYNLELHDHVYKSWVHINDCFVTLSKSFEIENVDFMDINHLVYYESYLNALKHVEQTAVGNEAFNVNMNYLSKFCSLEQSETIKMSTNWLNTLFGSFYSQNNELKGFLDSYFQVNNTNLSFLENQVEDYLNIFSKEFIEYHQNIVVNNGTTSEAYILLIPTHYYENDLEGLFAVMESSLKDKCYIGLIHEHDGLDDINELTRNIVDAVHGTSDAPTINVNILCHIPKNVGADEVALNKDMILSFEERDKSVNILKGILCSLSENSKVDSVVFGFSNTPEKEKGDALKYFQEVMSQFESSEIKIVMDDVTQESENLYKPISISYLSHHTVVENGQVMREVKQSRTLDFVPESSFDILTSRTQMNQLILFDASLSQYLPEVYVSLTPDTEILVYHSHESFDMLKDKIRQIVEHTGASLNNVSLFKKNIPSIHFSLFDEENSLKYDVLEDSCEWTDGEITDPSSEYFVGIQEPDVSMDEGAYNKTPIYPEGHLEQEKEIYYSHYNGPDPSLNTWHNFSDFLLFLQDEIEVSNFDILTCKLVGPDWTYILETLQERTPNMTIHSSIDTTGHVMFEGDWILETPENVNLVGLYFNEKIYDVKVELDSYTFTNLGTLQYALRDYIKVSTHETTTGTYGDISTWKIGSSLKTLSDLMFRAIWSAGDYNTEKDWSKIDGMSDWDISHVTSLNMAFRGNSNYLSKFNAPIGSWNVSNVVTMRSAFSGAILFDKDISGWDTGNVTDMAYMFQKAWSFNQNIDTVTNQIDSQGNTYTAWNTTKVTTLESTFHEAINFNKPLNNWDVGNVTNFVGTFYYAASFDQDISNWNVSNGTTFSSTFLLARNFSQILGGHWKNLPVQTAYSSFINSINTYSMFDRNQTLTNSPTGHIEVDYDPIVGFTTTEQLKRAMHIYSINGIYAESLFGKCKNWNVSNLTNMDFLFSFGAKTWVQYDMEDWDVSKVTSMEKTFYGAGVFNSDIGKWNVSNVRNMRQMFYQVNYHFNRDLSSWDVGNVTDMTQMFYRARGFRHDLSNWNTTNADTTNMFQEALWYEPHILNSTFVADYAAPATTFTSKTDLKNAITAWGSDRITAQNTYGHISNWNVSAITDFEKIFEGIGSKIFQEDLNNWDVGNVTTMYRAFWKLSKTSAHIESWNVSNVTTMYSMFYNCNYFSCDISGWDVGNVLNMAYMFTNSYSFNEDISGWDVSKVTDMNHMFNTAKLFNRDLTPWNVDNVTNVNRMFLLAEGINQVFKGKWMDIPERMDIPNFSFGSPNNSEQRLGIGFKNNGTNITNNYLLRQIISLYAVNKRASLINYPEISQWNISNIDNLDDMLHGVHVADLNISGWDVSHVTSMSNMFNWCSELEVDFSNWNVSNVKNMNLMFSRCYYSKMTGVENWNVSNVTDMDSMFNSCYLFNGDISNWNVKKVTKMKSMFSDNWMFEKDISKWKLESITTLINMQYCFNKAFNYNVVLGQLWTVLHEQLGTSLTNLENTMFPNSPGSISDVPYNAPKITFTSSDVANNGTSENDEINMEIILTQTATGSVTGAITATNGTIKNFAQPSDLLYEFVFTASTFGVTSQFNIGTESDNIFADYIVEPFEWTWSPPVTVMTFNSPDISNNQTQTSSSIDLEIILSREFITNQQLIQKEDISASNGTITGFQRVNNTQYTFTFIASSPNVDSAIEMQSTFDASNAVLPTLFTWTWTANIEQPSLVLTSADVANNGTIKKNIIDMLLTYTPNTKLAFASLTESDISFTNGFIVGNSFAKISPTQYSFRFKSLSRDTNSTIYIPQDQFQYNYVDGATNLTENYEGSDVYTWKYNGLDIELINNKTVAVITSEQKESKSLDLTLHGNVIYDPIYNEYEFDKSTSDYITISGEIFNGSGEASISFWYKTKSGITASSFATILTLRNSDDDNFTLQRKSTSNVFYIKSSGDSEINTITTNLAYENTTYVHMVIVFTQTNVLVYKNGVLEETHAVSNVINGGERTYQMIGASVNSNNGDNAYRYFTGLIKNLRFYNYAIISTEVNALYTMYNTRMNDTAPQILSINLTTTDTLTNNENPKAVINMEMDVSYDSIATISSIDTQSFIIDESNFDTSFGYVFDFRQLSDTKVSFKFGASTAIYDSKVFVKQDTITRNINSSLNVVSNPESNIFTWKYNSEPLTIQSIKSNIGATGSLTNQDIIWIQVVFSEEVFNFRKKYITGTNCKVIKTTGSGKTYTIKVRTFRPIAASIVIDIPTNNPITIGKGLSKAFESGALNTTYNWDYDNNVPTYTIETSQESGLTNNEEYVDFTVITSKSTSNFDINSINVNGSAEIVNFSGSGQNYSYRIQPFASSAISVTFPTGAFSDDYGNENATSETFTWTYHNIKPEVYIASQDINSGDSADVVSIETYFVFSKPVSGFSLAVVDSTNGNLSELSETTAFPDHETTFTVTIGSKVSANNPYTNKGSSSAFFLNGEEAKVVSFVAGNTYTFNNASNSAHPLKFYTDAEKTSGSAYTAGVTVSATSTIIVVDSNTPTTLYYQCEAHEYMGNIITYGQSYKAILLPASSSVSISLQIADNKVKDDLNIFNDVASNTFVWNYTGTKYMVSIESPDLKSGASHLYKSIQISLTLTYATFDTVDASMFTVVNGTITNVVDQGSGNYTFTLESVAQNTETSLLLPENSVTRYNNNSETNEVSNKFVWTYTPPIPELTITSGDVKEGAFTNNSSIDLQLEFTENVVFDVNAINITNGSGTLSGANNSYVLTVVPDVVADSSADILVSFPEGTGFYNVFDNEQLYNDVSYNYSWKYDSVIPTGTIVSSISELVYQDVCSNVQDVPFIIEFNKNIPSLNANDFTITSNGALSGLSGLGSLYSFVISALDNTIDNTLSFKLGDGAITDEAGNTFSSSNEFSFTINAKVSKLLETAAIAELFTEDADIAEEDKLSADEINMILAVEIPDLTVPDFDEVESGEVTVDVSYNVTIDAKTSSNSYYNQGSSSAYFIDGIEAPSLAVDPNNVYRFNQDDATNSGHPLLFYEDVDKSVQYTTDVSVSGTPGSSGAYTQISITSETPTTLYYQCGNHDYMGGTITVGEVDAVPVVSLPPAVKITNNKVFTRLIDQILEKAEDVTAIKMGIDDVTLSETATEKIPDVEQVVIAKSNQIEPPVVIENTDTDSVLFVPLANEGDLVKVGINGVFYLTVVNSDNTFSLTIDGVEATGSPFSKDDVYVIDDTNSIIFGSQIISSSPPTPSPPTVDITSSVVQEDETTTTGNIDLDLSFSTTIEIDLNNIYPLTNSTQITSSSIQSVDSSNSIVVVSVSPIFPDVSAELGIIIYDTTFYSTSNNVDYYNDVSFSFSWTYDSTAYNNANVVEIIEEYEPVFINPYTGFIPCFLRDTNILTKKGYKKIQDLVPGKDKLVDHKNNVIECLEVKKYVKQNDGTEYPYKIPGGSQLSKDFTCNQDLFLTYNHCVYLPSKNMYAPVALMKNIKRHITNEPYFVYYHVFTNNYFSDTIIANGIPCEGHSKYTFRYLRELDNNEKLLKKVMKYANMQINCQRNRISRKDYKKLIKKSKRNIKNKKQSKK